MSDIYAHIHLLVMRYMHNALYKLYILPLDELLRAQATDSVKKTDFPSSHKMVVILGMNMLIAIAL